MLNTNILKEYYQQRKEGYQANHALSNAKINVEFDRLESLDLVKFEFEEEHDDYFSVYGWGNCGCDSSINTPCRHDKALIRLIESNGLYCGVTYWRTNKNEEWEMADSIGMLIGYDHSGYGPDLKQGAINEYLKFAKCGTQARVTSFRNGFTLPATL
jgi:hypothetical protein